MAEAGAASVASTVAEKNQAVLDLRLVKSSVCEEDVYHHGHHSAWGSWYDAEASCWGYACCHCVKKTQQCTNGPQDSQKKRSRILLPDERVFDWGEPPSELLPREKVTLTASLLNSRIDHQGCFIAHFVRYVVGTWRRMLGGQMSGEALAQDWNCPSCGDLQFSRKIVCRKCGTRNPNPPAGQENGKPQLDGGVVEVQRVSQFQAVDHFTRASSKLGAPKSQKPIANVMPSEFPADLKGVQSCEDTEKGMAPFMRQLQANKADPGFVEQLDKVVSLAAQQEYVEAGKAYMEISADKQNAPSQVFDDATTLKVLESVQKIVRLAEAMHPSSDPANTFTT